MTVTEFIRLTPFQKARLQQDNPEEYKRLFTAMNQQFPKEDFSANREVKSADTGKSKVHTID